MRGLNSIIGKLALPTVAVLTLLTGLIFVGVSARMKRTMIDTKVQGARMANELFLRAVMAPVFFDDPTAIKDTVALLAQDPEVLSVQLWRVAAGPQVGGLLASQLRADVPGVEPRLVERQAIEQLDDRVVLRDAIRDRDGKVIAVAAVQLSLASENRVYAERRRHTLVIAAGSGVLLALVLWAVTRRWISGPLARLLRAIRQVEAGQRVDLNSDASDDEVGRLADAFARMAEAVERRERDLSRRNNDMKLIMDNVAQGLLSVRRSGALLPEHSAVVETWLGPWPEGATFPDYLRQSAPQAADWLAVLWDNVSEDLFPLEVALAQLPARLSIGARVFEVSYRPMIYASQQDDDPRILIVLSDITAEIEQERARRGQQELLTLVQWMVRDRAGLLAFFADADRLVERVTMSIAGRDRVTLKREAHTLKGNCGMFGLRGMVEACQAAETRIADEGDEIPEPERGALRAAWQRVCEMRRQVLGTDDDARIEVDRGEHQALIEALTAGAPYHDLRSMVVAWTRESARQRLARFGEQARQLARRLGKGEVGVVIDADALRLPTGLGDFWQNFAHVLTNAIDHGLEPPEERRERGKSDAGTLRLRAVVREGRFLVEIADDGRGIDWERLRAKARAAGLPYETRDDLVAALFADGISTRAAVTETSGRGVGMSAVRSACERSGGAISVDSEPGAGTRFRFGWPATVLKDEAAA